MSWYQMLTILAGVFIAGIGCGVLLLLSEIEKAGSNPNPPLGRRPKPPVPPPAPPPARNQRWL